MRTGAYKATLSKAPIGNPSKLANYTAFFVCGLIPWNFFANNLITFRDKRLKGWAMIRGLLGFYFACSIGALFSLVSIGRVPWVPVAIIAVREIGISLYRVYWGRRGLALPASRGGKLKTLLQGLAIAAAVMPPLATAHAWVANSLLWASVVVAVVSAGQYLWAGRAAATTSGSGSAPDHAH